MNADINNNNNIDINEDDNEMSFGSNILSKMSPKQILNVCLDVIPSSLYVNIQYNIIHILNR